jgi:hypothetical protein
VGRLAGGSPPARHGAASPGAVYLYTDQFAGKIIPAQKLALVMMLWVALLGASMATYERSHLALEMGEKLWPARLVPYVKATSLALASAFCVAACYLAIELVSVAAPPPPQDRRQRVAADLAGVRDRALRLRRDGASLPGPGLDHRHRDRRADRGAAAVVTVLLLIVVLAHPRRAAVRDRRRRHRGGVLDA